MCLIIINDCNFLLDFVLHPPHCGERIHSLCGWWPLCCCVSLTHPPTLSSLCDRRSKQAKITKSPLLPLQIPVLPVRQSDWHAVSGQCCVCSAAAAPVSGHDGTPGWRPVLGMNTQLYLFRTHTHTRTSTNSRLAF